MRVAKPLWITGLCLVFLIVGQGHIRAQDSTDDNDKIDVPRHFEVKPVWTGAEFPVINGMTDLPDGVTVVVSIFPAELPNAAQRLAQGMPACAVSCNPAVTSKGEFAPRSVVRGGRFSAGPFTLNGAQFLPGRYKLEVYVPAGRMLGEASADEWVNRKLKSFRTPAYRGWLVIP